MLRKRCQESLNKIGLTSFHVEINNSKELCIKDKCSKQLMAISGIKFTRKDPTKAEIEYALELFNEFLTCHEGQIEDYLSLFLDVNSMQELEIRGDGYYIFKLYGKNAWGCTYSDYPYTINISTTGVKEISFMSNKHILADIEEYSFNKELYQQRVNYLNSYVDRELLLIKLSNMAAKLNSCNI